MFQCQFFALLAAFDCLCEFSERWDIRGYSQVFHWWILRFSFASLIFSLSSRACASALKRANFTRSSCNSSSFFVISASVFLDFACVDCEVILALEAALFFFILTSEIVVFLVFVFFVVVGVLVLDILCVAFFCDATHLHLSEPHPLHVKHLRRGILLTGAKARLSAILVCRCAFVLSLTRKQSLITNL